MHLTYAGTSLSSQIRSYLLRLGSHFSAAGEPVSALVRCAVPRAARSGALGRRQVGAVCRRYGDAGAGVDGGAERLRGVEAGRQVRTGDQSREDARGGRAGELAGREFYAPL